MRAGHGVVWCARASRCQPSLNASQGHLGEHGMRRHERRSPHLRQLDRLLMPSIPRIQERKDVDGIDERAAFDLRIAPWA